MTDVSPVWADWLAIDVEDFIGHGWTNYVHPADRELSRRAVNAVQAGHRPDSYRQRWVSSRGRVLVLDIAVWIWVSATGLVRRVVGGAWRVDDANGNQPDALVRQVLRAGTTDTADGRTVRGIIQGAFEFDPSGE